MGGWDGGWRERFVTSRCLVRDFGVDQLLRTAAGHTQALKSRFRAVLQPWRSGSTVTNEPRNRKAANQWSLTPTRPLLTDVVP
ncbi:hypothetical protein VTK56DRAFT_2374 [Thermocarpiscus australiensis]